MMRLSMSRRQQREEFGHFSHFSFGFTCELFRPEFPSSLAIVLLSLLLLFVCHCWTFCNSAGLQSEWKTPLGRHMLRSAFSTTLLQWAFTRHFRFFQIVLLAVNSTSLALTDTLYTCFQNFPVHLLFAVLNQGSN
jgi:hypothetical protein